MKTILSLFLVLISSSAMADYFSCEIKYSPFLKKSVEAEYRVLEARVEGGTFICEGKIAGNETIVTITSTETGETNSHREKHSVASVDLTALDQWGDGLDHGTCTCGMK